MPRWMDRVNQQKVPDLPRLPSHALDRSPTKANLDKSRTNPIVLRSRIEWSLRAKARRIHQQPKSGISFGSRNAAMTSKRWPTGSPLLRHLENKTQSSGQRVDAQALSSRIGNRAWSALMRRNRSLPFSPGISKSRTARSKAERSQRNACIGQLSNTTE
jgi:hypothetical protein